MTTHTQKRRSLAKSFTFRILVILSDLTVIYFITHRADVTIGLTIMTNLFSTLLYFLHERVWSRISWGRNNNSNDNLHTPV